jgi:hypothetical protein
MGVVFGLFSFLFAILRFVIGAIVAIAFIACYIVYSISLRSVAIHQGHEQNSVLAFIPIAQWVLIGLIQQEITLFNKKISNLALIFPLVLVSPVSGFIVSLIPLIGWLFGWLVGLLLLIAAVVFFVLVNIEIMKKYEPRYAIVYGIFSPIGYFLIFLGLRKNKYPPLGEIPIYTQN